MSYQQNKKAKNAEKRAKDSEERTKIKGVHDEKNKLMGDLMIAIRKLVTNIVEHRAPSGRLEAWPGAFHDPATNKKGCLVVEIGIVPVKEELQPKIILPSSAELPRSANGKIRLVGR